MSLIIQSEGIYHRLSSNFSSFYYICIENIPKGSSMAFVFRGQKRPIFQDQNINKDIGSHEILTSNQTNTSKKQLDLTKIAKGLPCSKQKLMRFGQPANEQVGLPQFEIKRIHQQNHLGALKHLFSLDKNLNKQEKAQKENCIAFNQLIQTKHYSQLKKSSLLLSLTKQPQKNNCFGQKTLEKKLKIRSNVPHITNNMTEPNIANKNLLKTLSSIKSKLNTSEDCQQLGIISQKSLKLSLGQRSSKGFNFHSLKRLSPIKSIIKQTLHQEKDINLLLSKEKSPEQQKTALKLQKVLNYQLKQFKRSANCENQDEEDDQEFDQDATPGPGTYNYEQFNQKKNFQSKKQKFRRIFYSSLERFQNQFKFNEVTLVNEQKQPQNQDKNKNNKYISFLSNSPRFDKQKQCIVPPPGYYNTRETLEYDLIKNILKSYNSKIFINTKPRQFITIMKEPLPGPGTYNIDNSIERTAQQHGSSTFAYKSRLPRNLQYESSSKQKRQKHQDSIFEAGNKDFRPIHIQNSEMLPADYEIQVPPFLSNSERFPNIKPVYKESFAKNIAQCQTKKQVNKQAFNSSQKRKIQTKVGEGVGVGLYNLPAKDSWNRKSHNILFN